MERRRSPRATRRPPRSPAPGPPGCGPMWPASSSTTSLSRPPDRNDPLGYLLRRLFHGLDLEHELHLVAHQDAAGLQCLVPAQTEILAIDARAAAKAGALAAPGVLAGALVGDVEDHGLRHAMHGQVSDDTVDAGFHLLDLRAAEGGGGKLLHVQEIGRSQVRVALRVSRVDARRIDGHLHRGGAGLVRIEPELAAPFREPAAR